MIQFRCPHCGLETHVDDRYAGQTGPCAGCNRPISIPTIPATKDSTTAIHGKKQQQKPGRLPLILRICLAVSLLALILFGGYFATRNLVTPIVMTGRQRARVSTCQRNLQTIGTAMLAYHADHGHLPPAYTVAPDGTPLHSWRVLLLPYLGAEAESIYQQIDLNSPWTSPQNSVFAGSMPSVYGCPEDNLFAPGDTSYLLVTGPNFAFDGEKTTKLEDFSDAISKTLLVIETTGGGINWMQPRDATAADLARGVNSGVRSSCSSAHADGICGVLLADGSARLLSDATSPEELVRMATIQGGEETFEIYADE